MYVLQRNNFITVSQNLAIVRETETSDESLTSSSEGAKYLPNRKTAQTHKDGFNPCGAYAGII